MKRSISVFLVLILLISAAPFCAMQAKAAYKTGDLIQYGNYPQSRVTDEKLLEELEAAEKAWVSYGYYKGSGIPNDGDMKPSDYMKYCDVLLGGKRFRGVRFSEYRPRYTYSSSNNGYSYQKVDTEESFQKTGFQIESINLAFLQKYGDTNYMNGLTQLVH